LDRILELLGQSERLPGIGHDGLEAILAGGSILRYTVH